MYFFKNNNKKMVYDNTLFISDGDYLTEKFLPYVTCKSIG